ncbi:MAG: chromate transporter [Candidatus Pristimantibacillus lignocellulolyticus]|uniref:Chromate transporter n=1 Tax=Candidatus Pristimantibacillus lignocellulolyticus TaxID=2994561 RepID=A0A9J6Z9K1_9BACL|nr:MAG: chromate transporter [Candidatus Pristimantibacillus lignocellulolyticus]
MKEKQKSRPYIQLMWGMMKTGIVGFGGGPSVIPLIRHEAVKTYQWINDDEFGEILAIANALPGPIATKIAAYLGYRIKGVKGAVVAVLGHILPSSLAMILLMSGVYFLSASPIIQGMISAVIPVVAVMLGVMMYEFGQKAVKGLGIYLGIVSFVLAFLLLQVIEIHPAIVIIVFLSYGTVHFRIMSKWKAKRQQRGDT